MIFKHPLPLAFACYLQDAAAVAATTRVLPTRPQARRRAWEHQARRLRQILGRRQRRKPGLTRFTVNSGI